MEAQVCARTLAVADFSHTFWTFAAWHPSFCFIDLCSGHEEDRSLMQRVGANTKV